MESGKYSPLREAHERIKKEQEVQGAKEVTDRQAEQGDRETARPEKETTDRTQRSDPPAPERSQAGPERRFAVPEGPAPNETEGHFRWRVRETENLERNWQRERRWEAVRKGNVPTTSHHEPQRESKPSPEADVEPGNE
jgi:hypothetical protein